MKPCVQPGVCTRGIHSIGGSRLAACASSELCVVGSVPRADVRGVRLLWRVRGRSRRRPGSKPLQVSPATPSSCFREFSTALPAGSFRKRPYGRGARLWLPARARRLSSFGWSSGKDAAVRHQWHRIYQESELGSAFTSIAAVRQSIWWCIAGELERWQLACVGNGSRSMKGRPSVAPAPSGASRARHRVSQAPEPAGLRGSARIRCSRSNLTCLCRLQPGRAPGGHPLPLACSSCERNGTLMHALCFVRPIHMNVPHYDASQACHGFQDGPPAAMARR